MKIEIPYVFTHIAGGSETVEVEGHTVGECLSALQDKFPGIRPHIFDEQGQIYRYVNLYLNGAVIDNNNLALPVKDEDQLSLLVVIYGG